MKNGKTVKASLSSKTLNSDRTKITRMRLFQKVRVLELNSVSDFFQLGETQSSQTFLSLMSTFSTTIGSRSKMELFLSLLSAVFPRIRKTD